MRRLYHVIIVLSHPEPHSQQDVLALLSSKFPEYESESKPPDGKVGAVWISKPLDSYDITGNAAQAFGNEITNPMEYEIEEKRFVHGAGAGMCLFVYRRKQWWQFWK